MRQLLASLAAIAVVLTGCAAPPAPSANTSAPPTEGNTASTHPQQQTPGNSSVVAMNSVLPPADPDAGVYLQQVELKTATDDYHYPQLRGVDNTAVSQSSAPVCAPGTQSTYWTRFKRLQVSQLRTVST